MQTVSALELITTTVGPEDCVGTIRHLARPFGPKVVAVVHEGVVIGLLDCALLLRCAPEIKVRELMERPLMSLESGAPIRKVAQDFLTHDLDAAPVFEGSNFLGIVTTPMLLREVGRSWDPLTGLGWSDRLREWGISRLREGREITVLFFDLDDFGQYNKRFGHIVGDYILQVVSSTLKRFCENMTDIAVRYGGDEFAICTLRNREDAEKLVREISDALAGLMIEQESEPVAFSVGVCGGRRTIERDQIHFASTMDNLISLASKDCMAMKVSKGQTAETKPKSHLKSSS